MNREKYDKCTTSIRQIDDISDSSKTLMDSIAKYNRDLNGKAEFVIYTEGEIIKTTLTNSEANKVAALIFESYKDSITKTRKELNDTLNELYSDLCYDSEISLSDE